MRIRFINPHVASCSLRKRTGLLRDAPACSEDQRARRSRSCLRARARTMIIIMHCPAPAIFEGRPAPLLPYCEARRSERAAHSEGRRRDRDREQRVRERERGIRRKREKKKNAPVLTSRHGTPRIRALYVHYIGTSDFRNTGFLLGPISPPPSGGSPSLPRYAIRILSDKLRQR